MWAYQCVGGVCQRLVGVCQCHIGVFDICIYI